RMKIISFSLAGRLRILGPRCEQSCPAVPHPHPEVLMPVDPINLYDYEARAQQVLPHDYWDFIAGGSKDELTTRRNRSAFDAISLRPRFLREVAERKLATTVLGTPISFPVMICPAGGHKLAHPEGECATARGAGMSNTLMMLSTSSHYSMEEVMRAATGPLC